MTNENFLALMMDLCSKQKSELENYQLFEEEHKKAADELNAKLIAHKQEESKLDTDLANTRAALEKLKKEVEEKELTLQGAKKALADQEQLNTDKVSTLMAASIDLNAKTLSE